ncbi:MAG TPA: hypothetical protein VGQ80_13390, partial [Acidimicrobiia bacterium]|nr:hypothetical protein [Acidimicrobiia bacterium]
MSEILRHRHPNRFTVLPNDAIRNRGLSFRAVGVLAHLLSLPDGAKVDSITLATSHREGRDAVRGALSELGTHGYYRRTRIRLADGTLRTEIIVSDSPMPPTGDESAVGTGDGFSGAGPEPGNPASAGPAPVNPTSDGPAPVDQAPKEQVPKDREPIPPQPPRSAGGPEVDQANLTANRRRAAGTNPRAVQANPRAEADLAEAARLEADAASRRAELERATADRRAADHAADLAAERFETEALALSGRLDDTALAAIVTVVSDGLAGPLVRSRLALSRAVVAWCRTAARRHPGPLIDAVAAGLAGGLRAGEADTAPLDLPVPPPGTEPLRRR